MILHIPARKDSLLLHGTTLINSRNGPRFHLGRFPNPSIRVTALPTPARLDLPLPARYAHLMPKAPETPPDPDSLGYEQAVEELERIVERIESGEASLEQSMKLYERGTKLLRRCRSVLDQAEQRLSELDAASLSREGE